MATSFEPPPPAPGTSSGSRSAVILVAVAVVAVLALVVAGLLLVRGAGDGDEAGDDDQGIAPGDEHPSVGEFQRPTERRATSTRRGKPPATRTTTPEDRLDDSGCPTEGETVDIDSLPDPDVTATPVDFDVSRQGRISAWPIDPFNDETWPYLGEVYSDVEPGGYVDIPVHLEAGEYVMVFSANDCIRGDMLLFGPDGSLHTQYEEELGDPGVIEGWEFTDRGGDALSETGTYVIRAVQHTGVTGGHPIRFYAPAG